MSKVLCPIDFSPSSERAQTAAIDLARHFGADLYLLHVVEGMLLGIEQYADAPSARSARETTRARLDEVAAKATGIPRVHVLVATGDPAEEIRRVEEMFGIDLIVLAPHGRKTVGKILFGSVAEAVIRAVEAAVLIVKPPRQDTIV